ncbi:unnamed protein product [Penicillium glandicola]
MSNETCSNCTISSANDEVLVGWVWDNPGRGTISLITTCLATIFLCTWVVIHPRVYKRESYANLHKIALFFKTIFAPEFIAVEGLQEWAQCRRMQRECADFTAGQFRLVHAFYISMLALRYQISNGDRVIWPNQYTWLLQQGLIRWEDHPNWGLSLDAICDKSKSDNAAKLLALMQVTWFSAQCILRISYHLPLSQLESMTLGYIPLFIVTYFFWWNKPKDIRSPSLVMLPEMSLEQFHLFESMAVSNKFDNEGMKEQTSYWNIWYLTPRVFEKVEEDRLVQEAQTMALKSPDQTPINQSEIRDVEYQYNFRKDIVVAHWDPDLYRSKVWPLTCLFGISFGALHLVSWNTMFPSIVELWLWRVSAFVSIVSMLIFMHFEKVVLRWDGILTLFSLSSPVFYLLSRIVMMGEAFAVLRAADPAIYNTYEYSAYWLPFLEIAGSFFKYASIPVAVAVGLYAILLGLLTTSTFQSHVVYLHAIQMTWFKDLNVPESFGFLKNQVTPFSISTTDGEQLYAWHILPVELYRKHQMPLVEEPVGFVSDIKSRLGFQLLREDPDARLILHMHGAGGTVASGYRVPNYRALSAGNPGKIHVLTFDYRGFGKSTGTPSETGLIIDALAVVDWAMNVAGIPPSRILIFGQSMGTAVSIAVSKHLAVQNPPIIFAGTVLVAPFVDVATLVSTYRVAGTVPILSPVARFPFLFKYLQRFIRDKWLSKDCIAQYIRTNELNGEKYRISIIHAEDDYDIPWHHSQLVFWHAVNASMPAGISYDDLEQKKLDSRADLGAAGSMMEWRTENGVIREEILKTGLHDVIMGYPIVTMAVMRFFEAADPSFTP